MVNYTTRKSIPYPTGSDTPNIASRDLKDLAFGIDAELVATEAYLLAQIGNTVTQIGSAASQLRTEIKVQGEEFEQLLEGVSNAYEVAVSTGYKGTMSQWLESLKGPQGKEGPFGGTSVTDPQVASYIAANTATRLALESAFVARLGERGKNRTVYVRATGNDSNNGSSATAAFREIRTAVESLAADGPVIRGSVVIDVGPGVYKGGIRPPQSRGTAQDDYLVIRGPNVGAHPNIPTVIIDYAADPTASWGFLGEDGATVWLENIKFVGAFPNAVRIERNVFLQWRNVHIDGQGVGLNGLSVQHQCRYAVIGGIIENLVQAGIVEIFGNTRSFGGASSNETQMIIRKCNIGLQAKEAGVGHLDWINVEDCGTGIQLNGMCVANVKGVSLKRNSVGIANVNSEIHNAQSVRYGSGLDANGRGYIAIGSAAADLTEIGWTSDAFAHTTSAGARSLITLASSYADSTLAGTTAEADFYNLSSVIPMQRYNVAGRRIKVVLWGSINTALTTSNGYRLILRLGSILMGEARIPQTANVGDDFRVEFEIVCSADGNSQKVMSSIAGWAPVPTNYSPRSFNFTDQAGNVGVRVAGIAGGVSESVTLRMIEVWG